MADSELRGASPDGVILDHNPLLYAGGDWLCPGGYKSEGRQWQIDHVYFYVYI